MRLRRRSSHPSRWTVAIIALAYRTLAPTWWWLKKSMGEEADPGESEAQRDELRALRVRIALGVVLVSILSAGAVWRASVADERAAQSDAIYRQQLVAQQGAERAVEDAIQQELDLFGSYEEHAIRADQLDRDSYVNRRRLAAELYASAQRERRVANVQWAGFQTYGPDETSHSVPTFRPAKAYRDWMAEDREFQEVAPGALRQEARNKHRKGVHLTGIAALFIASVLLLTLAEVMLDRGHRPGERAPKTPHPAIARTLAYSACAIVAVGLFLSAFVGV